MQNSKRLALFSVSDREGIVEFAKFLVEEANFEIIASDGTSKFLADNGISCAKVEDVTHFSEILEGRVKTLHPKIHGGILAKRDNETHLADLARENIAPIDLVVVNLYPFFSARKSGANFAECIEKIDIGGVALLRAAAKNFKDVTVVLDKADYAKTQEFIKAGQVPLEFKQALAAKAFSYVSAYDAAIAAFLNCEPLPERLSFAGNKVNSLRYGENPHQPAAAYGDETYNAPSVLTAQIVQGKEMGFNNYLDAEAAFSIVSEFSAPSVAIIKHHNPCGAASANTLVGAYKKALACDSLSAFGGVVALNRELDKETAEEIIKIFTEVVIAPNATKEALEVLATKKNLRVLLMGKCFDMTANELEFKGVRGGFLAQAKDSAQTDANELNLVTDKKPDTREMNDLLFAWKIAKHVKSNAIVYVKDEATIGVGAGQMSRVDAAKIAARKALDAFGEEFLKTGFVVASDAFFPFADGLTEAAEAGATAVIQPGGSMRDEEVIAQANKLGIAMALTGVRHFKH